MAQGPSGLVLDPEEDVVEETDGEAALMADMTTREVLVAVLTELRVIRDLLAVAVA